ncbi:MAG: hypothetical protein H6713_38255 [Myxococcales bacterium]|nr:hypothetical protein [Myxococcales bacterium]
MAAPEGPSAPLNEDEALIPFNIGVAPGASINAKARGKKITNYASISFGFNQVYRIQGIDLSLGATVIDAELSGLQASLGFNKVTGMARGLQSTIGANLVEGRMIGVQGAVGGNVVNGVSRGIQAAVGFNGATELAFGMQAGVVNYANHLHGAQFGVINHGRRLNGASFGVINVVSREVKGAQFGLINYAEEADASVALLPITRRGGVHASIWTSDLALLNVAVQLHARKTYSFFTAGVHPLARNDQAQAWMYGLGFGGRIPISERFFLDIDNVVYGVHAGFSSVRAPTLLDSLRLRVVWKPHRYFGLYGGPTLNAALDVFGRGEQVRPGYAFSSYNDDWVTVWPGFVFGVEL